MFGVFHWTSLDHLVLDMAFYDEPPISSGWCWYINGKSPFLMGKSTINRPFSIA